MKTHVGPLASLVGITVALGMAVSFVMGAGVEAAPAASEAAAQTGGSAVGHVRFLETPPEPERLRVNRDNDVCGLRKLSQDFIVSEETKGLKNVVLTIIGARAPAASAGGPPPPVLEQQECVYGPHVQTAVLGQKLQITNRDDLLHDVHAYADDRDTLFNVAEPFQGMTVSMTLEREGVVTVECDVHDWMKGYVVVASHPYIAVTDEDGAFRIDGIPPGSYKVRAWHEALGELEKDLTIVAGRDTTVSFDVGK